MLSSLNLLRQDLWSSVNLMCILKGNNRRINFKLSLSGPFKSLGVTDVHDKVELERTSKGGQNKAETTICFHMSFLSVPSFLSYHSGHSQAQQTLNKTFLNSPLLRIWPKKLHLYMNFQQKQCLPKLSVAVNYDVWNI